MLKKLPTVAKAVAAALTAGAGALATALPDGVTVTEWTTVAVAAVVAGAAVWRVPNRPADAAPGA